MSSLYIASKPAIHEDIDYQHLYIVYDPDDNPNSGDELIIRGGPPGANTGISDFIYVELGVSILDSYDGGQGLGGDLPWEYDRNFTLLAVDEDADTKWAQMLEFAISLTNSTDDPSSGVYSYPTDYTYAPLYANSNSTVNSLLKVVGLNILDLLPVYGGDLDGDGVDDWTLLGIRVNPNDVPGVHNFISGSQSNVFTGTTYKNVFFDAAGIDGQSGNDIFFGDEGKDAYVYITSNSLQALHWKAVNDTTHGWGYRVDTPDGNHDLIFDIEVRFNKTFTATHSIGFTDVNAGIMLKDQSLTEIAALNAEYNWINGEVDFIQTAVSVSSDAFIANGSGIFANMGTFTGTNGSDTFVLNQLLGRTFDAVNHSDGHKDIVDYSEVGQNLTFTAQANHRLIAGITGSGITDTLIAMDTIHMGTGVNTVTPTEHTKEYTFIDHGYAIADASYYTEAIYVVVSWATTSTMSFAAMEIHDNSHNNPYSGHSLGSYINFNKVIGTAFDDYFVLRSGIEVDGGGGNDHYIYQNSPGNYWDTGSQGVGGVGAVSTNNGQISSITNANNNAVKAAQWAGYKYTIEDMHPYVITSAAAGGGTSTFTMETYLKTLNFMDGITADDIRMTVSNSSTSNAALTIYINTASITYQFTITDFEAGRTITGVGMYDMDVQNQVSTSASATLTGTSAGHYTGTYGGGITYANTAPTVHYNFENMTFQDGSVTNVNMQGTLTLKGSSASDTLYGMNTRDDIIYGMDGSDSIWGKGGNDTLYGGAGNDYLYGEAGDDILDGGAGGDTLTGGLGNDYYVFSGAFGADFINGDTSGQDTARLVGYNMSDVRIWTDNNGYLHIESKANVANNLTIISGVTGVGTFETSASNATEFIQFDDVTIDMNVNGLTLEGKAIADTLYGTKNNDIIFGYAGNDTLHGNRGDDTLHAGDGNDNLYGGQGNDSFVHTGGTDLIVEYANEGIDTVYMSGNLSDYRIYTDGNRYVQIESKATPTDRVSLYAVSVASESDIDTRIEYVVFNGVSYSFSDLAFEGTTAADTLFGTQKSDTLLGYGGNDTLYGYRGDDILDGGLGNDYLYGGDGDDTYFVGSGTDLVVENANAGVDTVKIAGNYADYRVYTDSNGYVFIESKSTPTDKVSLSGGKTSFGTNETDVDTRIEHLSFNDVTIDLSSGLTLEGTSVANTLYGTQHDDVIYGYAGNDTLYGNRGDDILDGGAGADNLYGGEGADTFLFKADTAYSGVDNIRDFSTAQGDVLDIRDLLTGYDPLTDVLANFVTVTASGANSVLSVDRDGAGTAYGFTQVATITNLTGYDAASMMANGYLLVS